MSGSAGASQPWANPQKEGYLNKRGHVVRNWKKRWFRLKNDMLYYFKDPDAQPVGEVPLKRSEVAPTNKVNKPFCFELNSKEIEKVCCCILEGMMRAQKCFMKKKNTHNT